MTTCVVSVGREVDTRIDVEKAARHQLEAGEDAGLNRKVFRPDLMMKPEHVPEDDVGVLDVRFFLTKSANASSAVRMVHVLAGRIALFWIVGCDPELVLDEVRPLPRGRLRMDERRDRMARLELVCRRRANPVLAVGVDTFQARCVAGLTWRQPPSFGLQNCLFFVEAVAIGIVGSPRIGVRIEFNYAVLIAVDIHVEASTENVLVDMTDHAGRDFLAVFARLARDGTRPY